MLHDQKCFHSTTIFLFLDKREVLLGYFRLEFYRFLVGGSQQSFMHCLPICCASACHSFLKNFDRLTLHSAVTLGARLSKRMQMKSSQILAAFKRRSWPQRTCGFYNRYATCTFSSSAMFYSIKMLYWMHFKNEMMLSFCRVLLHTNKAFVLMECFSGLKLSQDFWELSDCEGQAQTRFSTFQNSQKILNLKSIF